MIVYHVTSISKFLRYLRNGRIGPPVRAWETIEEAERFSKQTGRQIILRLKFPDNAEKMKGHKNKARILNKPIFVSDVFNGWSGVRKYTPSI